MELHICDILDNYHRINLTDRIKFVKKLYEIHEEYKYDDGFAYDYGDVLDIIKDTAYYTLKGQNSEEFYNSLNDKQKKELQTQIYLIADKSKNIWSEKPSSYDSLKDIYNPEKEYLKEEQEEFKIDFDKLYKELETCGSLYDGLSAEKIIRLFTKRYYRNPNNSIISEFNLAIEEYKRVIRENINESTRNKFDSLTSSQQLYTILTVSKLNKFDLDRIIEYRKELREKSKYIRINCKHGRITLLEDINQDVRLKRKNKKKYPKIKERKKVNKMYY